MWRQSILLKPTDTELLEEADCTHKLPGARKGCWAAGAFGEGTGPSSGRRRSWARGGGALSSLWSLSFWFSSKGLRPDKKPMTDYKNKNN